VWTGRVKLSKKCRKVGGAWSPLGTPLKLKKNDKGRVGKTTDGRVRGNSTLGAWKKGVSPVLSFDSSTLKIPYLGTNTEGIEQKEQQCASKEKGGRGARN